MTGGPLFVSSGNPAADQHYGSALQRVARGDLVGAADVLAQTVQLAPAFATAWFALGAIRDGLGDRAGAIAAWQTARDADPEDYHGARLQLARLGAGETTPAMTAAYVRRLFDQQAASFDETLQRLDYRGPAVLLDAVRSVAGRGLHIGCMLDLGCGTGLGGAAFRPCVDWLVGVDISPAMVAKARAKGLYDRLAVLDLQHFLQTEAQSGAQYDLVVAADVFVYVSDLVPITAAAARVLAPDGDPVRRRRCAATDLALRARRDTCPHGDRGCGPQPCGPEPCRDAQGEGYSGSESGRGGVGFGA